MVYETTVKIYVNSDSPEAAETMLSSALDNLVGGDIEGYEIDCVDGND